MRVLVTGATGFVGSAVIRRLLAAGHDPVGAVRSAPLTPIPGISYAEGLDFTATDGWSEAICGVDAVIHTAARVHVMQERASDPLGEFRRINRDGTVQLARSAARAGVKRFVFLSSIKVNGEITEPGQAFRADDQPQPVDPYGISKREAEDLLFELSGASGMEVTVIRPPLIYGPGVKANFLTMMRLLHRRIPLPLAAASAKRSLVALDNLSDLLLLCLDHPAAAGRIFLVSDGDDLSVADMLRSLGAALGCNACLLPVPVPLLELSAHALGRPEIIQRLLRPLLVDLEPTRGVLGWFPPFGVSECFDGTAKDFLRTQSKGEPSAG